MFGALILIIITELCRECQKIPTWDKVFWEIEKKFEWKTKKSRTICVEMWNGWQTKHDIHTSLLPHFIHFTLLFLSSPSYFPPGVYSARFGWKAKIPTITGQRRQRWLRRQRRKRRGVKRWKNKVNCGVKCCKNLCLSHVNCRKKWAIGVGGGRECLLFIKFEKEKESFLKVLGKILKIEDG